jgi:hypothetical protein
MRGLIAASALLVSTALVPASAAEPQSVDGTWTGVYIARQGQRFAEDSLTLELRQNGQDVTGSWSFYRRGSGRRAGQAGEGIPVHGTLVGDKLSLEMGTQRWLEATITGDTMSGKTASGNRPAADLTATRVK